MQGATFPRGAIGPTAENMLGGKCLAHQRKPAKLPLSSPPCPPPRGWGSQLCKPLLLPPTPPLQICINLAGHRHGASETETGTIGSDKE